MRDSRGFSRQEKDNVITKNWQWDELKEKRKSKERRGKIQL